MSGPEWGQEERRAVPAEAARQEQGENSQESTGFRAPATQAQDPGRFRGGLGPQPSLTSSSEAASYVLLSQSAGLPGNPQPLTRLLAFAYIEAHSFAVKLYGE